MPDTIYLDPDLFMALGLSAEAHGGIGALLAFEETGAPCCIIGHAAWLDGMDEITDLEDATPTETALWNAWPWPNYPRARLTERNDDRLLRVTDDIKRKVPFTDWCRIVGVDVAA